MRKTVITWLVNASVAAFAVGALNIPFKEINEQEYPALFFAVIALGVAIYLSRKDGE